MFFDMAKAMREYPVTREELNRKAREGAQEAEKLLWFFERLPQAGFYLELEGALSRQGENLEALLKEGAYDDIIRCLLYEPGLGYSQRPKGLIPFHRYGASSRTPVAEHFIEAGPLVGDEKGICRLHFTISPEHEEWFKEHLDFLKMSLGKGAPYRFVVSCSFQKASSDTLSLDAQGQPVRDDQGRLLFRPGGHGALIKNLQETIAPFVFIKNIDNVAVESVSSMVIRWEKIMGGVLIRRKTQADHWLAELDNPAVSHRRTEEINLEIKKIWGLEVDAQASASQDPIQALGSFLNRPMRVCGVVPNTGEPGGGPFWVRSPLGGCAPQIVESSQVNLADPRQNKIFQASTHFNPVDMVCALKDRNQKSYDLNKFIDPQMAFLSRKSWKGREIRALERPGLWNGAMSDWITFFVEIPQETFHPVKTVYDLLKPSHRENNQ